MLSAQSTKTTIETYEFNGGGSGLICKLRLDHDERLGADAARYPENDAPRDVRGAPTSKGTQ